VVGAHDTDAIANHASNNSDTGDVHPINFAEATSATKRSSPRSASTRLPWIVALRYRRRRVPAAIPAYTRTFPRRRSALT